MSVTLQDHIFPVTWFLICMKCPLHSMQTILYLGLNFKTHLPGCLFLKYTQSPTWMAGFLSNDFFAIARANLCIPESGSAGNHYMCSSS